MPRNPAQKLATFASRSQRAQRAYRSWIQTLPVDDHAILLEQQIGLTLDGSMYYLLRELLQNQEYADYTVYFVTQPENDATASAELSRRGLAVATVPRGTKAYMRALATSKYVFCDNTLPPCFTKRDGQVLTNTWHGIPLKTLGRGQHEFAHEIGNVQRCLALSDYLLMPNEATEHHMADDYMLRGISQARVLPLGYPRNEAFLAPQHAAHPEQPSTQARTYAWLPTFRTVGDNPRALPQDLAQHLHEVDALLTNDEMLYLKAHPASAEQLDLTNYAHVRPFPTDAEAYEVLATCDALITDYSSVMFDFPLGGNKVVLWPFDAADYLSGRGTYADLDSLPFPKVQSANELVAELRIAPGYANDEFVRELWPYPTQGAAAALCQRVLLDADKIAGEHAIAQPSKPTMLVYSELACDLDALLRDLALLATTYDVRLAFPRECGAEHGDFLTALPREISYTPLQAAALHTASERLALARAFAQPSPPTRVLHHALAIERRRLFGKATFDEVIIHDGTWSRWLALMGEL